MTASVIFAIVFVCTFLLGLNIEEAHAQNNNGVNPMNNFNSNAAYGGRWASYSPQALSTEASYIKAYSIAIYSLSYIGLYIGIAILGVTLTWIYWHLSCSANRTPKQIVTIVTSTVLAFLILLLLLAIFSALSLSIATP